MISTFLKNYSSINRQQGAAMMIFIIIFLFTSLALTYILANGILADQQAQQVFVKSKQSYFTALSANEDILYRYINGMSPDATEVISLAGVVSTSTVTLDSGTGNYLVVSDSNFLSAQRSSQMELTIDTGIAFNFGLQSGQGGISMANSSAVNGNVYSNGPVTGANSMIRGDIISAGPSGLLNSIHATGSAYAHTITNSTIDVDAHYQSISGTSVGGTSYPGATDKDPADFPIDDATIAIWEAEALAGGTYGGCSSPSDTYVINTDIIIGPLYIPCNLEIDKNSTDVTLAGTLWAEGDITIKKGTVIVASSLAGKVVPIIAHNYSDPTSSKVVIQNSAEFTSTTGDAFVMLIAMNDDGETGGSDKAITIQNSSAGELVLYAPHGILEVSNNTDLRQATAWKIEMGNSALLDYDQGLMSPDFTSGPAGTFVINRWTEIY